MGWTVDDIDLDTLAFNISNRAASWKTPPKRGTNLVIPGRHGARWLPNKPFEQGNVTLNMWAVGAEEDGTMPEIGSSARKVRENIDKLTAIFGQSSKLLDVVRVSSTAFGVENTVNDPSFETQEAVAPWASYQNQILNPAMRKTTASVDEVNNLMPNPLPQTLQTPNTVTNYENLVNDPNHKLNRGAAEAQIAFNGWSPGITESSTEPDGGEWNQVANVTGEAITIGLQFDKDYNPPAATNNYCYRMTATAGLGANAALGTKSEQQHDMGTGAHMYLSIRARRGGTTTGTRGIQIRLTNTESDGTNTTSHTWQTFMLPTYVADDPATWITCNYNTTGFNWSADGYYQVEFRTNEAWSSGNSVLIDSPVLVEAGEPAMTTGYWQTQGRAGPYFDGYTGWANYDWFTPGNQPKTRTKIVTYRDTRWSVAAAVDTSSAYYAYAYTPNGTDASGTCVNFVAFGMPTFTNGGGTAGGTQTYYLNCANPTAGETYTWNFNYRARAGTYEVRLQKKSTGDPDYVDVGSSATFSGGNGTASTSGSQMTGTSVTVYPPATYTAVSGDLFRIRVTVPVFTDGNPVLQINNLNVTNAPGSTTNGDSTDTANNIYSWSGTTYNSKTNNAQRRLKRLSGKHAYITGSDPSRAEIQVPATGTATKFVTENFSIINGLRGIHGSASVTASLNPYGTANGVSGTPNAVATVVFLDAGSSVISTVSGVPVTMNNGLTSGSYKTVNVSAAPSLVPAAATQVRLEVAIETPLVGQMLHAKEFGLYTYGAPMTSIGLPAYFDGSTAGAAWISTAHDSTSKMTFSGTEPAAWVRENGINLGVWIPGGPQKTGKSPDSYLSFRHPMGVTTAAQEFQFGVESYGETYDANGTRIGVPLDVFLEFRSGTTTVVGNPVYIGTLGSGNVDLPQPLQTTVTPTGSFDNIAVVYRARTAVATTAVAMFRSYLYPSAIASYNSPVPRMEYNRVNNPYFTYGLELWAVTGSPVVSGGVCTMPNGSIIQSSPRLNPPTHVRTVTTGFTAVGSPKTSPTFDVTNGDLVVIQVATADESHTQGTPTWTGSGTVAAQAGATIAGTDFVNASTWTIPVAATATGRTVSVTNSNTTVAWGFTVSVWRNHNGVGAVAEVNTTGPAAPSLNITTTVPGSAIAVLVGDYTGGNIGVPRTWRTVNNAPIYETAMGDSSSATYFSGMVTDAGAQGVKTVGLTTPSNAKFTVVAIEIRPAAPTAITGVPVQPPDRILRVETPFSTTGPSKTTPTFDVQQGDLVIIQAHAEGTSAIPTPTWTGTGSIVLQEDMATGATRGRIWSIDVTAAATLRTVSITGYGGAGSWAIDVTVWRGHGGIGVQNQANNTTGAPAITQTVAASSAVQFMALDDLGNMATLPVWATINSVPMVETRYERLGSVATLFSGYTPNVGSSGSKTFGLTLPASGMTWGATAIEILGAPKMNFISRVQNGSGNGRLTPSIIWTKTDYSTVTVTLPPIDSPSVNTPVRNSVAIPANAVVGAVKYVSSVSSGSDPHVSFTYLGTAATGFTSYLDVEPFPFYYGDATSGDFFGTPGWWSGGVDDSFSNFQPAVSPSWVNQTTPTGVAIHELPAPSINYGVWNGQVGGILAAPKGVTRTVRSMGAPTFGRNFVSGEISVGTKPFASVQVKVYQASTATATGVLLYTSPVVGSASSDILTWFDLPVTDSFVYIEVLYTESENVSGYRVFFDNFAIIPTDTSLTGEYPGYFDGNIGGIWTGVANNSVSTFQGGGRRAWCEVVEAIDFSSMAGGTRAEFTVDMVIPSAFWEDLSTSTMVFNLPSLSGYEQSLHALASATAPIDDAFITLNVSGTVTNLTITDVASNASLTINGTLPSTVKIDNSTFRVMDGANASIITNVTRQNSNGLLPLNPVSSTEAPKLRFEGTGAGTISVSVAAKRRYLVA